MSRVNTQDQAMKAIGHIQEMVIHYSDCQEFAIERLGAIIASAEFERDLLKDIQKNKPEIEKGGFDECVL